MSGDCLAFGRLPGGAVPAASLILIAVLAQPAAHRVEVLGRGGTAFWSTGGDLWVQVRGEAVLDARRDADGTASAQLTMSLVRDTERWTVELSGLRPGALLIDADLPGPGGLVHAAVALGGTARVTRSGEVLTDTALLRATALTTGYHSDDGTFRTLPAGRSGDLELLVHVDGLPGGQVLDLGLEHPQMRVDGLPVPAAPMADATTPPWPGAHLGTGTGGSGSTALLPGPVEPLPGPGPHGASSAPAPMPLPAAPAPANAGPATTLPQAPAPANAAPAGPLPASPPAATGPGALPLPASPAPGTSGPAGALPVTPAPANSAPATPLPMGPAPGNAAPALPLPSNAPVAPPIHGATDTPAPTWFPAPVPTTPVPARPRESRRTRFARRALKIDPSVQASTVRPRVQLRARALDLSRKLPRVALADGR